MCGIAASIAFTGPGAREPRIVETMITALAHRGDRQPEIRTMERAVLACARLAIVDRDDASQPMLDSSAASTALVFNGEIYNFRELRQELQREGRTFLTCSDTEVILQAYLAWGPSFLEKLHGMYAVILVDAANQRFIAARDPFGIKPLYYGRTSRSWLFSSEILPLVTAGASDIAQVPSGGCVDNGSVSGRALYPGLAPREMDFASAKEALRAGISTSVRSHLDTDLPVAVFCSGGIDSSIILYEASKAHPGLISAFTVGTADAEDRLFAEEMANLCGVPFHWIQIAPGEMVTSIPETIAAIESFEPNHIRAGTTGLRLARAVRSMGFKVGLFGEGADELFGGYEEFPETLRRGSLGDVESLLRRFSSELYKTQLQRVDRTTMAVGLEARVPFLHTPLTRFIQTIPTEFKVARLPDGRVVGKHILREAYRGILPDHIVDRRKVPMGEGAGIGDNGPKGPFHEFTESQVSLGDLRAMQERFPAFNLSTREEAYYFGLYQSKFGPLPMAAERPRTNLLPTT
jgi:asparagine synthase (glutamine-hydrolysing)